MTVARYIIRRLLQAIPTLLGVSVIAFLLVNATPGDPILIRTFDPSMTQETREILRRQLGLDQPLPAQYLRWFTGITIRSGNVVEEFSLGTTACTYLDLIRMTVCDTGGGVLRGNLGTSLETRQPVW